MIQQQAMILGPYMGIYDLVVPKDKILRNIRENDKKSNIFISNHYGEENQMNAKEVEKVILTVENNDVYVRDEFILKLEHI